MEIKKVTVFGAGNFGARLAFHIAFNGIDVTVYDRDYGLLEEARTKFREFSSFYEEKYNIPTSKVEAALANIAYSMDIPEAAGNAQLIIEAVAEDLHAKKGFYEELQHAAPKNAIFGTTSQSLDPEILAKASGKSQKFISLHFNGNLEQKHVLEIVALPAVTNQVLNIVSQFFEQIGMEVNINHLEQQD
ncbi:3-hydroxyacyl-CoA dehydrogenase NAD-binding domain-containing protein [Salinimicrobium oceani]|uniref:3-hydroxyacyl-CoA dehydrogenase NAD binding domain-containing protein n=1 Tax=Salinimicrobium oceani TaxID=2722702 RepID=A0ABX1CYL8_9FLAO|nr:3-hydroxyacyl-CoA dehydrogenase NAD-binding domain-containing protein [Salinimicrobium oceani]NJW53361.1 hypothetical protein [Salinimicrobium oceani]